MPIQTICVSFSVKHNFCEKTPLTFIFIDKNIWVVYKLYNKVLIVKGIVHF